MPQPFDAATKDPVETHPEYWLDYLLLHGIRGLEESVTYQAIIRKGREERREEGRVEEARSILLRLGGKRFGPAPAELQTALGAIGIRERLEQLSERLLDVESWDELLAG